MTQSSDQAPATTVAPTAPPVEILGYRELTTEEVGLINTIKEEAAVVERLVQKLFASPEGTGVRVDKRWAAIGAAQLQQGFMALNRSVAKPTSF